MERRSVHTATMGKRRDGRGRDDALKERVVVAFDVEMANRCGRTGGREEEEERAWDMREKGMFNRLSATKAPENHKKRRPLIGGFLRDGLEG